MLDAFVIQVRDLRHHVTHTSNSKLSRSSHDISRQRRRRTELALGFASEDCV